MGEQGSALSVRERQAVLAVEAHYAALGRPPIVKEIGTRLGLEKSQTYDLVKAAARKGWLRLHCQQGKRTEIRLMRPGRELSTAELTEELARRASNDATGNDPEDLGVQIAA